MDEVIDRRTVPAAGLPRESHEQFMARMRELVGEPEHESDEGRLAWERPADRACPRETARGVQCPNWTSHVDAFGRPVCTVHLRQDMRAPALAADKEALRRTTARIEELTGARGEVRVDGHARAFA